MTHPKLHGAAAMTTARAVWTGLVAFSTTVLAILTNAAANGAATLA